VVVGSSRYADTGTAWIGLKSAKRGHVHFIPS
jgi:hypothetical protein